MTRFAPVLTVVAALLLVLNTNARAQDPPGIGRLEKTLEGEREVRIRIEGFFVKLQANEVAGAFADLFKGSPQSTKPEVVSGFVNQTEDITKKFGKITSHEMIHVQRVGKKLLHFTYLSHSDHYPLKWEIYCYQGKGGWQLLDFSVNTDLAGLFGSTAD